MGENTPPRGSGEQEFETPQERGDRLAREMMVLHGPKQVGQGELFDTDAIDPKVDAEQIVTGIGAQKEAEARERDARRAMDRAAALVGMTSLERAKIKVQWEIDDRKAAANRVNAGVSGPRRAETSPVVVDLESSAEIDRLAQAAQLADDDAVAQTKTEAYSQDRATRIEAAHKGANQSRQVLEASQQDKKKSAMDLAHERVAAEAAGWLKKLEAAEAEKVAAQGHSTALQEANFKFAESIYNSFLKVLKGLDERSRRTARRPEEPEVDQPEPEVPAEGGGAKVEWKQGNLIGTREEAILKAAQLAAEKKLRSEET